VDYSEAMGNFPYDKLHDYGNLFESTDAILIVPTVLLRMKFLNIIQKKI